MADSCVVTVSSLTCVCISIFILVAKLQHFICVKTLSVDPITLNYFCNINAKKNIKILRGKESAMKPILKTTLHLWTLNDFF